MKTNFLLSAVLVAAFSCGSAFAQGEPGCGSLRNSYGPFDYRTANADQKAIVENAHFTPGVETLTRGKTGAFGGDLRYTLIVFPNHPRALIAMERLVEKERANPPRDAWYTIECFYERAMRFRPDDHIPRLLYVNYLIRTNKQLDEARQHLRFVADTKGDEPLTQFNVGMLYADLKDYDKALVQAHRVIALGFERRELRDRLIAAGRWTEPGTDSPAAPASATSN